MLEAQADELAVLESRENGKPVADARLNDINFLIDVFRFLGSLIDAGLGTIPLGARSARSSRRRPNCLTTSPG